MRPALPVLLGLLLLASATQAQTNADCTRDAEDATRRVERDMARQAPSRSDTVAHQRWSQALHEQLAAVNRRYEDCRRSAERPPGPQEVNKLEACREAALRQSDELRRRYAGRSLSFAEQTAMRNEEVAIMDARQACMQKATKG